MINKLAFAAVFSIALLAGVGLVSYNNSVTTSLTIAEVTSAETVNLGFSPATQSVKPGETKTITLEATYSPTITLTAIDLALNYDPSVLTLKKLESPTLTTTLVPPHLDTSPATFTFGLNPQDLVNANADQQVCPQHVDPNNSGRCVNLVGSCGGYTNGCMMGNICRKPFRSCTNNTPDPLRTLLLTYEVKSNATPNTTTTLTIADSTQLAITSRDDNALGTKAAHTINIVPPITTGPGDFNVDGRVNLLDFNLLLSRFGTEYTIFHFTTLIANFGKTY